MNSDYAKKQAQREAEYEREYRAWVESMPADERKQLAQAGLATPSVQRHGNGAAEHDMADSPRASHTPDMAALVEPEEDPPETQSMGSATEILRRLVADIVFEENTRLVIDCLTIALGLRVYAGDSMTMIAKRHGITRAAVSKRCVDITERLKLPPSRAMRSETARRIYRNSQLKRYRSEKS
jgi:hypothetical protein